MKKKIFALVMAVVMIAIAVVGGTLAYLTDDAYDENVMVFGNVDIEQNEYQWNDDKTAIEDFEQDKLLFPYVGKISWDAASKTAEVNGAAAGAYRRFDIENVLDKYVTVKNTGKNDAYVRTIIALPMGELDAAEFDTVIGLSNNAKDGASFKFDGAWVWGTDFYAEIDGQNYYILSAVHDAALAPNAETVPSLCQIYMQKTCTNDQFQRLGNADGQYIVLALSQAVQTNGFDSAAEGLDEAFGAVNAANVKTWFEAK